MTDQDTDIVEAADESQEQEEQKLSPEELREKNLSAFRNYFPSIFETISNYKPQSELVYLENGEPDVLFNGVYLYDKVGAYTYCKQQMEAYWQSPIRFSMGLVDGMKLDPDTNRLAWDVNKRVEEEGLEFQPLPTSRRCFYLYVLGIGLGTFIEELADETQCEHLSLYEINFELFYHSMSVTDWTKIFDRFPSGGTKPTLSFTFTTETEQIKHHITSRVRAINPGAGDGLTIYGHFKNAAFETAVQKLIGGDYETAMMGLGYYEDEYYMVSNAYKNLQSGNTRILKSVTAHLDIPVFICGNGPSLDTLMPFIKKNEKNAMIISCGSTLDALLNNDLMPDFHVMIERSSGLMRDQRISAESWDISKICFVGSTNIFPEVANFHDDKIMFFRPGISPQPIFTTDPGQIGSNGDPLVANAALCFCLAAGFKNIYFCGVDAGAKDPAQHHSKDSQYHTRGVKYRHDFNKIAPANFGGTVHTTSSLLWSKKGLEQAIKMNYRRHKYFNLSDGALIEGALPKHFSRVSIPAERNKKKKVREVIEQFDHYTEEMFNAALEKADLVNRLVEVKDQLVEIITENDLTELSYLTKFCPILKPAHASDAVAMIYRGTIHSMIIYWNCRMGRLETIEEKRKFEAILKEELPKHFNYMCDEMIQRIKDLENDTVDWTLGKDLDWQREWQEEFVEVAGIHYEKRDR